MTPSVPLWELGLGGCEHPRPRSMTGGDPPLGARATAFRRDHSPRVPGD